MSSSLNPQILIEICHNCKAHQWCTRHNEKSYENISVQVYKTIKDKIPDANIQIVKVQNDKIGSFEVFCNNYQIFSKRTLGYFPHAEAVTQRIIDYLDGKFQSRISSPVKRRPETGEFSSPAKKAVKPAVQKESGENKPKITTSTPKLIKQQPKVEPRKQAKTPVIRKEYAPKQKKQEPKPKQQEVKLSPMKPEAKKQQKKEKVQAKKVQAKVEAKVENKVEQKVQEQKVKTEQKGSQKVSLKKIQSVIAPAQQTKALETPLKQQKVEVKEPIQEQKVSAKEQAKKEEIKTEQPQKIQSKEPENQQHKIQKVHQEAKQAPKQERSEEPPIKPKTETKENVQPAPSEQIPKAEQKAEIKPQQHLEPVKSQTALPQEQQEPRPAKKRDQKPKQQVSITVQEGGQKQQTTVKYKDFQKQVQKCFDKLDIDKGKFLQSNEVQKLSEWFLKELDMEMSEAAKTYFDQCFIGMMAKDNDGKLTMAEFKKMVWDILAVADQPAEQTNQ